MKHVHVPLTDELHGALMNEAQTSGESAASIARQAILDALRTRRKRAQEEALRAYALQVAGTEEDLDPEWAETALESLSTLEAGRP